MSDSEEDVQSASGIDSVLDRFEELAEDLAESAEMAEDRGDSKAAGAFDAARRDIMEIVEDER